MNTCKKKRGKAFARVLALISLFCLMLPFSVMPASAQSTAKIMASSCTVEKGDSAAIALTLQGNPGIWGLKLRIHYDHAVLTLKSVSTGSVFDKSEFTLSENLNKDPYVIVASGNALQNKTANGAIATLNFSVSSSAALKIYPVTVEIAQANNIAGEKVSVGTGDGGVTVVSCKHADKEWRVSTVAQCEKAGKETLTCKKCGATFDTRAVNATGHRHTEIRGAVAATKTAAGYTGDTYCKDCGKLIAKGTVTAKINSQATTKPTTKPTTKTTTKKTSTKQTTTTKTTTKTAAGTIGTTVDAGTGAPVMTSGENLTFHKNSQEPLVFVSDAELSTFIRAEIDGTALEETYYTLKSGSTIVTVSADYLKTLDDGAHQIAIVSKGGTATGTFTVEVEATTTTTTATETADPFAKNETNKAGTSSTLPITIAIVVFAVLLVGGAVAYFVIKRKRG